jgi:hypothetical protein
MIWLLIEAKKRGGRKNGVMLQFDQHLLALFASFP